MPREHYDLQLEELQNDLMRLGSQVEAAIQRAVDTFQSQNVDEARRIIAEDDIIDRAQYALEDKALMLIALQAPLAIDLRIISAVMSIAGELERMADYAEGIAEITLRGAHQPLPAPLCNIPQMAQLAQRMLHDALDAFTRRDVEAARRVAAIDDEVDALTTVVQDSLISTMLRDPATVEQALRLIFVAHNLERVADRATNIAERVIFLVTGEVANFND
jgi:phosphate transport system protein